jgi:hypothetical protein
MIKKMSFSQVVQTREIQHEKRYDTLLFHFYGNKRLLPLLSVGEAIR